MSSRTLEARDDLASVWMLLNGSAKGNASILNTALLQPFQSNSPPSERAHMTKTFNVSQTGIVTWVMNHTAYTEASTPILYGNSSDGWDVETTLHLPLNSTVDIIMAVAENSMDKVRPSPRQSQNFWGLD